MSSLKYSRWKAAELQSPGAEIARQIAAASLHRASAALMSLAHRLALPAAEVPRAEPELEFYADASAPEGALYLNGKLVGWIAGVRRL